MQSCVKYFSISGILATIFTLLNIAAPMSKLFYVIKVKNTECLPFPIILMTLVVTTLWAIYGVLSDDFFLMVLIFVYYVQVNLCIPCEVSYSHWASIVNL